MRKTVFAHEPPLSFYRQYYVFNKIYSFAICHEMSFYISHYYIGRMPGPSVENQDTSLENQDHIFFFK